MISHTGYLVFARSVLIDKQMADRKLLKEIGMIGLEDEKSLDVDDGGEEIAKEELSD